MLVFRITCGLILAVGLLMFSSLAARADDPPAADAEKTRLKLNRAVAAKLAAEVAKKNAEAAENEPAADQDDAEKKEDSPDRFAVPEGGVKELLAFVQEMMNFRPKTREEALQYRQRGMKAMQEAAAKIKETATDEDKKLEGYGDVEGILLLARAQDRQASEEEKATLFDDLKAYLAETPEPSQHAVNAARSLASGLEYSPNSHDAVPVYRELGRQLAKNADAQIARTGAQMEGAARRLELVGQPMKVSGTQIDGSTFDWDSLRGKVVLVDFWATWCGPCLREIPNVKNNYELYHDKGFEVVAISLDRDRAALEKFLEAEQPPWITLHDGDWSDNDVALYYGVTGIPTVILVDQDGKVVSTRARGAELGRLLADLLGPAEAEEKTADDAGE